MAVHEGFVALQHEENAAFAWCSAALHRCCAGCPFVVPTMPCRRPCDVAFTHIFSSLLMLLIRLATPADIETLLDIRTTVVDNHLSRAQLAAMGITPETIEAAITAEPCAWIADMDGVAAGFAMADTEDGCVFAVFVRPSQEGRGVGRLLLAKAEAYLFAHHTTIWLETDASSRASGFYRKLGWTPVAFHDNGDVRFEKTAPGATSPTLATS